MQAAQHEWAAYLGRQEEEQDEIAPGVKMAFVLVPPGRFLMGSPQAERERSTDEALHEVEVAEPFYLGKVEVTQEQYEAVTKENPSQARGPKLPVESVTWMQATAFAETVTNRVPRDTAPRQYRLPREAEWEYACRGGRPCSLPFGVGNGRSLDSTQANLEGNYPFGGPGKSKPSLRGTRQGGSYQPNALGLFDMHGNVWEWCQDSYRDYPGGEDVVKKVTKPVGGPDGGTSRAMRGGSWLTLARDCRAANRGRSEPAFGREDLGFRLVRVVSGLK
jgi:formylglycine-generating enzyme required for sulfatase activity